MSDTTALVVMVALLALNAFFVGAEFAITSTRHAQLEPLVKEGRRGARSALEAIENVSQMLAICQLGITLASTGLGVVAEPAIAHLIAGPLEEYFGLPYASAHVIAFVVALSIVLYLHVVLGEMVPKNISVALNVRMVLIYAPVLLWLGRLVRPLIAAMDWLANHVVRALGFEPQSEVSSAFTVEEVATIVERSQAEGFLEDELGLLSTSLEFSTKLVSDVLIPPAKLVTVPRNVTPAMVEASVAQTGYSRFVVEDGGQLLGYLHIKDVLYADSEAERQNPIPEWKIRPLPKVAPGVEVEDALAEMQRKGTHLAQVWLEGQALGVVFLEDILEELVGEVRDSLQRD